MEGRRVLIVPHKAGHLLLLPLHDHHQPSLLDEHENSNKENPRNREPNREAESPHAFIRLNIEYD
jgi:hypothetical protein